MPELTDEALAALRAEHPELYRVPVRGGGEVRELVVRAPTAAEMAPVQRTRPNTPASTDATVDLMWRCVVWPAGDDLEVLRGRFPGRTAALLFDQVLGELPGAKRRSRPKRKGRRR